MTGMGLIEYPAGRPMTGGRGAFGPALGHGPWASPGGNAARAAGFTLMEMLVTLVLISFTTMLMFQMLGSYRIARERVQAQSGVIDRGALFQSWLQDSVRGLYIANGLTFSGDADDFNGTTLNPLYGEAGAPTRIAWRLLGEGDRRWIAYVEDGRERWRRQLLGVKRSRFVYLDTAGKTHDVWPPKLGKEEAGVPTLPAQVAFVRETEDNRQTIVAAVRGPLRPVIRLTPQDEY